MVGIHSKRKFQDRVEDCFQQLSSDRKMYDKIFRSYIGGTHGLSSFAASRVPLNEHVMLARAMIQYLAANQPKVLLTTEVGRWKPRMEGLQFQVSRVMKGQHFALRQQRMVLSALMYAPGILRVCREWTAVAQGGETQYVLKTSLSNVDFSDFVYDTSASFIPDGEFVGRRGRMPLELALGSPMFEHLSEDKLRSMAGGDRGNQDRLFFSEPASSAEKQDLLEFWEVFCPYTGRLKIWSVDSPELLYDEPWDGWSGGPLHLLDFQDIPNHGVGISPMCVQHDLVEAVNRSLSKSIQQADAAKNILKVPPSKAAEGRAVMEATDGQAVFLSDGQPIEVVTVAGPDRNVLAMIPILRELWNWQGGNINEVSGLGVSAPTATQGELIAQAASGMVKQMGERVRAAVTGIVEAIVEYELADEFTTEVYPMKLADGGTHWRKLTPEMRSEIESVMLNVDIDVYSMRHQGPEERLAAIMDWWERVAVPGFPIWQAQGGIYDMQPLHGLFATYRNVPEINEIALMAAKSQPELSGREAPMPVRSMGPSRVPQKRAYGSNGTSGDTVSDMVAALGGAA